MAYWRSSWDRSLALIMLLLSLPACTIWRPVDVSLSRLILDETPDRVRVSLQGYEPIVIESPEIRRDSIIAAEGAAETSVRVALSEVTGVEVRKLSVWRTAALVLIPVALIVDFCADYRESCE